MYEIGTNLSTKDMIALSSFMFQWIIRQDTAKDVRSSISQARNSLLLLHNAANPRWVRMAHTELSNTIALLEATNLSLKNRAGRIRPRHVRVRNTIMVSIRAKASVYEMAPIKSQTLRRSSQAGISFNKRRIAQTWMGKAHAEKTRAASCLQGKRALIVYMATPP